jgi:hypothetical protein
MVRFFKPGSAQDLSRAMVEAYSQRARNQELALKSLVHVENFTWTTKQAEYLSIVRRLSAQGTRHAT